ncbi:branched-chain-amino-acid transaminase [Methanococcus maripaludis]|uniref:Branched-chain-amino-acid aminotransferase n=1 Tax=Methanococcus maripaludis TaxID=39152 RepID=A0A7J9PAL7_METMI|nr:branched-chain-amino-acid transaminase [Methanococcus maripaludis]MBA2853351.1 branched-chain amino acid aminotransferase [Methanococcus maripaludis]MBA2860232.1 branched-chain amino acid aminotransferase [Methanococcus maripaludis]MBA2869304.1 branched-chain amino acid aminotransferase [Methanococcus maripaludis]
MKIYLDGNFVEKEDAKVSVYDHGLLYGDGVFEGIRAYDGVVFKLEEHIERLYDSADSIAMKIPASKVEMEEIVIETLKSNDLKDAYIRLVVTRGVGDLGLDPRKCPKATIFCIAEAMKPLLGEDGIKVITSSIRRLPVDVLNPAVKSLNYLNSILAKIQANYAGVEEAFLLDSEGYVAEGTGDNVFVIKNGKIKTPPLSSSVLKGITRDTVVDLAKEAGYSIIEEKMTLHDLFVADEIFITGTAAELIHVVELDGRVINNGKLGPITKDLSDRFKEIRSKIGKKYIE